MCSSPTAPAPGELVQLPPEIRAHLVELNGAGRREGGLWSAAGTLGAGAGDSIRLAVLGILFRAAGLPTQYEPARFVLWLKESGYYDAVSAAVAARGRELERELAHMYVSPSLAEALLEAIPGFAAGPAEVKSLLQAQYPPQTRRELRATSAHQQRQSPVVRLSQEEVHLQVRVRG